MAEYDYRCKECGEVVTVVKSMKDPHPTSCPHCNGPLQRLYAPVPVAYHTSGFYNSDKGLDKPSFYDDPTGDKEWAYLEERHKDGAGESKTFYPSTEK